LAGYARGNGRRQYDVTRDGQRFVMFRLTDEAQGTQLVLVQNFFEELRRKTGG
jgi:hypothetical protein